MQKTEQFQLNQWELSDRIQMADFNADNEKIEAALAAMAGDRLVVGSYTGDGTGSSGGTRIIDLGFKPKLVFVAGWMGASYALATIVFGPYSYNIFSDGSANGSNITIVENGFAIQGNYHNVTNFEEHYFALR